MVVTMGVIAGSLSVLLKGTLDRQVRESVYLSRVLDLHSAENILYAATRKACVGGDYSEIPSNVVELSNAFSGTFPDFSISSVNYPSALPFDRNSGYGPLSRDYINDTFYRVTHGREHEFTCVVSFSGEKAGLQSATVGAYSERVGGRVLEIPTVNYQLVTYATEFSGSLNSAINVIGSAFMVEGVDSEGDLLGVDVTDHSIMLNDMASATADFNLAQINKGGHITWGLSDMSSLFAETGTGITLRQSFLLEDASDLLVIDWDDPIVSPANLPNGVEFLTFDGVQRVVFNLDSMATGNHFQVRCNEDTDDIGIVIKGDSTGALSTVSIVTNGKVSLSGDNNRPCLIASNYSGTHALYTDNFIEGSSGLPAANMSFKGYLFFEQENLAFTLNENWLSTEFSLTGSLVFRGGSIIGPPTINLIRNTDFINLFSNGEVRSDKFAYITF
jgi:hypothetical protein